jgi:hypothetical protein
MESTLADQQQLLRSCEILFGSELYISGEFLEHLQPSGLKGAYRKRALETHPDRLIGTGQSGWKEVNEGFYNIRKAYENLLHFLKAKETRSQRLDTLFSKAATVSRPPQTEHSNLRNTFGAKSSPNKDHRTGSSPWKTSSPPPFSHFSPKERGCSATESLYCGPLPHRRLLFGHFLYYSGLANWRTITRILIWQRIERPRLGELGHRFGMLNREDITLILQNKLPFQTFGQTAERMGILSADQIQALLFQQQRLQKKFGTILLEKNLISPHELHELLEQFKQHNAIAS